jgi:hypothetical protein
VPIGGCLAQHESEIERQEETRLKVINPLDFNPEKFGNFVALTDEKELTRFSVSLSVRGAAGQKRPALDCERRRFPGSDGASPYQDHQEPRRSGSFAPSGELSYQALG